MQDIVIEYCIIVIVHIRLLGAKQCYICMLMLQPQLGFVWFYLQLRHTGLIGDVVSWGTSWLVIPAWLTMYPTPCSSWNSYFLTLSKIVFHTVNKVYFPTLIRNDTFWWCLLSTFLWSIVAHIPPTSGLSPSSRVHSGGKSLVLSWMSYYFKFQFVHICSMWARFWTN